MSFMLFMVKFKGLWARDTTRAIEIPHLDTLPSSPDTHLLGQPVEDVHGLNRLAGFAEHAKPALVNGNKAA